MIIMPYKIVRFSKEIKCKKSGVNLSRYRSRKISKLLSVNIKMNFRSQSFVVQNSLPFMSFKQTRHQDLLYYASV